MRTIKYLAFAILVSGILWGCGGNKGDKVASIKTDTVKALYMDQYGYQMARGVYVVKKGGKYDSVEKKAVETIDTAWTLLIYNYRDTIKDAKGKPVYDSITHSFRYNQIWYKLTDQENKTVKIQIIKI